MQRVALGGLLGLWLWVGVAGAEVVISNCDDPSAWTGAGKADREFVKEGQGALRWSFADGKTITLKQTPQDWTGGNALAFWVYSHQADNSPFWVIIYSEDKTREGIDYYSLSLRLNWQGWRRVVVPMKNLGAVRWPRGWDQIDGLTFHNAWDPAVTPNPQAAMTIDDIRVINMEDNARGPRLTDEEFYAGLDLQRPELAAVRVAVEKKDWTSAGQALVAHIRQRETPRWFRDWRERPKTPVAKPNTANADKLLAREFTFIKGTYKAPARIDWSHNAMTEGESATIEWNAQFNRHFHFKPLVDAYWQTGQEKYAREVVEQMVAWIEDCPILLWGSGNSPYHHAWETLNTAIRVGDTWPDALYRIMDSPALTDEALVMILKSLVEQTEHMVRWPSTANWLTAESLGVLSTGVLYPEFQRAPQWREIALERLYGQLDTEVYPDGLQIELALGYNNWVLRQFANVLKLTRLNGLQEEVPADFQQRLESMYNYQLYAMAPDGRVPGLNDSWHADAAGMLAEGLEYFPSRLDWQWGATRGQEGRRPPPDSVDFPYTGHYVMRSGWDPGDLYLLFDAGPFGAGHQHEDKLGLLAYAYGRHLLTEGGVYMYDASRWRRYVLSTRAHNTVRVDGLDQHSRGVRASYVLPHPFQPLPNPWVATPDWDFVQGVYEHGYGEGKSQQAAVTHTRSILFVKPTYWIVTDVLQPADEKEHHYEAIYHFAGETAVAEAAGARTMDRGPNLHIMATPAPGQAVEIVKGREEEPVQGWANGPWRPVPTALFTWKTSGVTRRTFVLYPTPEGQQSPVEQVVELPVTNAAGQPAQATAAEIRFRDGSRDLYLWAEPGQGLLRCPALRTDGRCALISLNAQGEVTRTVLCEGKELHREP
jgi:hypothetical protein